MNLAHHAWKSESNSACILTMVCAQVMRNDVALSVGGTRAL